MCLRKEIFVTKRLEGKKWKDKTCDLVEQVNVKVQENQCFTTSVFAMEFPDTVNSMQMYY